MGMIIGPTSWWQANLPSACPVGTTLPDGSQIFCKAGGRAWIVTPFCTQVASSWGNFACCGCIDNPPTGCSDHPQITDTNWSALYTRLISCGFNPSDWFVPNLSQLQSAYNCRSNWQNSFSSIGGSYWSSIETDANNGCGICCLNGNPFAGNGSTKATSCNVRAIRCITY